MQYVQEAPMGVERVNGAVMSGQVESHAVAEEPEQAVSVKQMMDECEQAAHAKQIAKELFPTGERLSKFASGVESTLTKAMQRLWCLDKQPLPNRRPSISSTMLTIYFNPGEMMHLGGHEKDCIPT